MCDRSWDAEDCRDVCEGAAGGNVAVAGGVEVAALEFCGGATAAAAAAAYRIGGLAGGTFALRMLDIGCSLKFGVGGGFAK